ncbi:site-specific integrase [Natronosalvus amylolyticus]|uniref:site-specific integrase n=1 Tax=Natronosalvus amylolyticus TaxID=2961994 RepID=UPI0020C9FDC6|nr:site-specific integrase [Natronosalvus amylolyticus]
MSLEELQEYWNAHIELELEREGFDPERKPTYEEITEAGYSGISYALREHHNMTLSQFLATVGYADPSSDAYTWGIGDETTIEELESYVRTIDRRRGLAKSTVDTKRARLAQFARVYADIHGQADLVERVGDGANRQEEIQRLLAVFDEFHRDLESDASKLKYYGDVNQFYDHLERRAKGAFNPVSGIKAEYNWQRGDPNNQPLTTRQVRRLYEVADDPAEKILVLGLCAWGLRRNEVASLHHSQLVLETDDPHIAFENRKNGPGTVALLYGVDELVDRIDWLGGRDRDWNGYVFPSRASQSGHIIGGTVQSRFQNLADRADVQVGGELPTSKMGRRFWYTTYLKAQKQLLESLDVIAGEQGSSDPSVVLNNYLSEAERRKYRREFMRERLSDAFEG